MRKFALLSLTALTAAFVSGAPAMTSQAAMFRIPFSISGSGNCQNNSTCVNNSGCQNNSTCVTGGNCDFLSADCGNLTGGWDMPALPGGGGNMPMLPGGDQNQPTLPESGSEERQVLNLVNEERSRAGLSPVTLDARAEHAADVRAQEIQQSFAHTRPDGSGFETALLQAGVNFRMSGENIAYGQNSAAEVMQGWMNSSGHRANILNRDFTSIGIGHAEGADGTDYWTQLFFN